MGGCVSQRTGESSRTISDEQIEEQGGQEKAVGTRKSASLQHISDREDLTSHEGTLFRAKSEKRSSSSRKVSSFSLSSDKPSLLVRSNQSSKTSGKYGVGSQPSSLSETAQLNRKKSNSCSTIFRLDSTVSQPHLKTTLRCVAIASHLHLTEGDKNREPRLLDIFDERQHPMYDEPPPTNIADRVPEPDEIFRFLRILFSAAKLTTECGIITLVYMERLLHYAELDLHPTNWKWIVLGSVLLSSKVWDDQAVWNVDYCQILRNIPIEVMNNLERELLELIQFNINVEASVYAKYYFDLRALAEEHHLTFSSSEKLTQERALKLEALSSANNRYVKGPVRRASSLDQLDRKQPVVIIP